MKKLLKYRENNKYLVEEDIKIVEKFNQGAVSYTITAIKQAGYDFDDIYLRKLCNYVINERV